MTEGYDHDDDELVVLHDVDDPVVADVDVQPLAASEGLLAWAHQLRSALTRARACSGVPPPSLPSMQ